MDKFALTDIDQLLEDDPDQKDRRIHKPVRHEFQFILLLNREFLFGLFNGELETFLGEGEVSKEN